MTLLLVVVAFALPIPIAYAVRPPFGDAGENARALRRRLLWIAALMATIASAHHAFVAPASTGWLQDHPTALFLWVPWMLLVRYFRLLQPERIDARRSAALVPRQLPTTVRLAWMALTLTSFGVLALVGSAAWEGRHLSALLLLLLVPAWLGFGYWLAARHQTLEAETFPSREHDAALKRAYAQRRSLSGWGHFANFAVLTVAHTSLALAALSDTEAALARVAIAAVVAFGALGGAHWRLRRRLDARIDALLTS